MSRWMLSRLPIFDIEAIFLKLHAASVSNVVKITIFDPETEESKEFSMDLNTVEIDESKKDSIRILSYLDDTSRPLRLSNGERHMVIKQSWKVKTLCSKLLLVYGRSL